ncbi:uncharacterized protein LOC142230742 [Haematobia irritans]|uniref:uncharacterized protein LOC142230742 n=1 Tax=Haematobia irritans TaxID=7368 RepID=UPI003F50543C
MKFIGIVLISIVVLCESQLQNEYCIGERAKDVRRRCAISHKVGQVEIDRFLHRAHAQSQNERCFRACVLIECKYFNADGTLRQDTARRAASLLSTRDHSKVNAAFQVVIYCQHNTPLLTNICDSTEAIYQCVTKNANFQFALDDY